MRGKVEVQVTEQEPEAGVRETPDEWLVNDLLQIDITEIGTSLVLSLRGELDANTAPQLRQQLIGRTAPGRRLVIDTTDLQFCGSSGLAVFLEGQQEAENRDAQLRIVVLPGNPLRRVLGAVGLLDVLPITPDLDSALR